MYRISLVAIKYGETKTQGLFGKYDQVRFAANLRDKLLFRLLLKFSTQII